MKTFDINILNNNGDILEEYRWIRNHGFIVIPHRLTSGLKSPEYYLESLQGGVEL